MTREISKRFAAIGDDLSPPKAKPAQKPAPLGKEMRPSISDTDLAYSYSQVDAELQKRVREQSRVRSSPEQTARARVLNEIGSISDPSILAGLVQARMELEEAQRVNNQKLVALWAERYFYLKNQARKQQRSSVMPLPYSDPGFSDFIGTMDYAKQQVVDVTGMKSMMQVKVFQEIDFVTGDLVVRREFPDGRVSIERFTRRDIEDRRVSICNNCGQPNFYPDGKTYHLCTAALR